MPINEIHQEREMVLKVLEKEPLTNREIQMICFLGTKATKNRIKELLESRQIERVKVQRIINGKFYSVDTKHFRISPEWKAKLGGR